MRKKILLAGAFFGLLMMSMISAPSFCAKRVQEEEIQESEIDANYCTYCTCSYFEERLYILLMIDLLMLKMELVETFWWDPEYREILAEMDAVRAEANHINGILSDLGC